MESGEGGKAAIRDGIHMGRKGMIGRVFRANRLLAVALVLAVALSGFFGWRLVDRALYWSDPAHIHQRPAPWMTIGYLSRSWHMPPSELAQALDLPPDHPRGRNFSEIAADQGVPVSDVLDRLSARLAQESLRDGGPVVLPPRGPDPGPGAGDGPADAPRP